MFMQNMPFLTLRCNEIMFSVEKDCILLMENSTAVVDEVSSHQGEAFTMLLLHAKGKHCKRVFVRSPSDDVDITILYVSLFPEGTSKLYFDYSSEKSRSVLQLGIYEKSVGTTELHYSTKKREHSLAY